jgi:hypothetical protein
MQLLPVPRNQVAQIAYEACRAAEGSHLSPAFPLLNTRQRNAVLEQLDWIVKECEDGPQILIRQREKECRRDRVEYSSAELRRDLLFATIVIILTGI